MINIQPVKTTTIQMPTNFRAKEQPQAENIEEKQVDSLDNPMETVGRSQVNFRGVKRLVKSLSAEELNMIARHATDLRLTAREVKAGKQALLNTVNEYGCKSALQLGAKINKSLDNTAIGKSDMIAQNIIGSFEKNIHKIDSKVNVDRAYGVLDKFVIASYGLK